MESEEIRFDKKKDMTRLRSIGAKHFAAAMAALTLWGAGDLWALSIDLLLADMVSLANAVIAGMVLAFLFHEWGHFTGARLSGAFSPVLKQPVSFFMFNFKFERNSRNQFLAMSMGGPTANWLLVILIYVLIPSDNATRILLLAVVTGVAINVSIFEIPVIFRTLAGGDPQSELQNQLDSRAPAVGRNTGIAASAIIWGSMLLL